MVKALVCSLQTHVKFFASGFVSDSGSDASLSWPQCLICKIGIIVLILPEHCYDTSVKTLRYIDTVVIKALSVIKMEI